MTVGNPFQIILFFAIPVLIGNVFQQLYSMVDTIIVGQSLGTEALAAVGSTGSLNFLVNGFSTGIAGGFAVLPAQFFGAKDEKRLKKSVGQAILLCLFFTVLLTALSVIFTRPVLVLMKTPENIIGMADVYIKTIFWGICATILYNMCSCVIRALGDSKTPLYFLILASFLNIGLDLLFIIVFKWGVFGAAFAIMTFNNDANVLDVFRKIYEITTGQASDGTTPLEVGYSIGLPVGILLFFNHFTSWKFSLDPTPLEVEMRLYEENVNKTLIQNEERKEDDIDVS